MSEDSQSIQPTDEEVTTPQPEQKKKDFSLKKSLIITIAAFVIGTFVIDLGVGVYRGEGVNPELFEKVLETLLKLLTTSVGE